MQTEIQVMHSRAARFSSSTGSFNNLTVVVKVVMLKLTFTHLWLYLHSVWSQSKPLQMASHVRAADDLRCKLVHYFSARTSCCLHMALYILLHMLSRRQLLQLVALIPSLIKSKSTNNRNSLFISPYRTVQKTFCSSQWAQANCAVTALQFYGDC